MTSPTLTTSVLLLALVAASCASSKVGPSSASTIKLNKDQLAKDIAKLKAGEHDPSLVGTWKGVSASQDRIVFNNDGSFEVQLHEQPMNKGHWSTERGTLRFVLLMQDDPEWPVQECTYAFPAAGRLKITPNLLSLTEKSAFRRIQTP